MLPEEISARLIYRDALILGFNKPRGVAVHASHGKSNNLSKVFEDLRFGLPKTPQLTHRLDKDTSGCLILGRHANALRMMGKLFENNQIEKKYIAIINGSPKESQGVINLPMAKQSERSDFWWMKIDENGKEAITQYQILDSNGKYSIIELMPKTGRTHQLRVHMQAIGCPIVGDKIYGDAKEDGKLLLHAQSITIPLYKNKKPITVTAPLPDYFSL
jgi:tRNA pseudouridine32 synthase / 23S rRNA pseudouridine746 synthase